MLDRDLLDASQLGAVLSGTLARLWPEVFELDRTLALVGSEQTLWDLRAGVDFATVAAHWQPRLDEFRARRERYLMY